jgi:hypothetical protein
VLVMPALLGVLLAVGVGALWWGLRHGHALPRAAFGALLAGLGAAVVLLLAWFLVMVLVVGPDLRSMSRP